MLGGTEKRDAVQRCVLSYLVRNPTAKDTAEGIRLWWLPTGIEVTTRDVADALEDLVERAFMDVRGENRTAVYALKYGRIADVRRFLELTDLG